MKWNKTAVLLTSLGIAAAGAVAYLLTTESGRNLTRTWRRKGEEFLHDVNDVTQQAKEKFRDIESMCSRNDTGEKSTVSSMTVTADS